MTQFRPMPVSVPHGSSHTGTTVADTAWDRDTRGDADPSFLVWTVALTLIVFLWVLVCTTPHEETGDGQA